MTIRHGILIGGIALVLIILGLLDQFAWHIVPLPSLVMG